MRKTEILDIIDDGRKSRESLKAQILKQYDNIKQLGGKIEKVDKFKLPSSGIERNIIVIRKIKETSKKYPRKAGVPSKQPLK